HRLSHARACCCRRLGPPLARTFLLRPYAAPPALRPVPPRRSSDLSPTLSSRNWPDVSSSGPRVSETVRRAMFRGFSSLVRSLLIDRKSTRLNSSHVKISYAGFCL